MHNLEIEYKEKVRRMKPREARDYLRREYRVHIEALTRKKEARRRRDADNAHNEALNKIVSEEGEKVKAIGNVFTDITTPDGKYILGSLEYPDDKSEERLNREVKRVYGRELDDVTKSQLLLPNGRGLRCRRLR